MIKDTEEIREEIVTMPEESLLDIADKFLALSEHLDGDHAEADWVAFEMECLVSVFRTRIREKKGA